MEKILFSKSYTYFIKCKNRLLAIVSLPLSLILLPRTQLKKRRVYHSHPPSKSILKILHFSSDLEEGAMGWPSRCSKKEIACCLALELSQEWFRLAAMSPVRTSTN